MNTSSLSSWMPEGRRGGVGCHRHAYKGSWASLFPSTACPILNGLEELADCVAAIPLAWWLLDESLEESAHYLDCGNQSP